MVKAARKKARKQKKVDSSFPTLIFRFLLFCINFFISIGEGTRVVLWTPLRFGILLKSLGKRFRSFLKKTQKSITSSFLHVKKSLFNRPKRAQKLVKLNKRVAVRTSPVRSHVSKRRSRSAFAFKWPSFHISLPSFTLPSFRFPHIVLPSFTLPNLKRSAIRKKGKKKRLETKSLDYYGIFVKAALRYGVIGLGLLWKGTILFLSTILKVTVALLSFLFFLIRKPFEFLNTLFTAQLRFFLLGIVICAIFFGAREFHQFVVSLPSPKEIGKVNYALATHLNDRNGKLLYEIYRDEKRTPVEITKLPKYVTQASIAIEDKNFYNHKGVSLVSGILRAGKETFFRGSLQGGSTITQQLVKSALLTPERTLARKTKEIILALWTEQIYSKEEILQMYMNQVPFGGAAYGIQEASKTYFGKDAKDMSIAEAALLAGLPQAPSTYSPFVNPNLALDRRNDVLLKMREQKYITESQYKTALTTPLQIIKPEINIKAPHFVFYVKSILEKELGTRMVEQGGLKVTTTLDLEIQQQVEAILKDELERQKYLNVTNGAILVTKPQTGEIIAMAGSVNYFQEPYGAFNVTNAARQPGSSLKPLLFSLALQKGATAATGYNDSATTFVIPGAEPYKPVNYDGKYHGRVSMRNALANSYNIPAVQTLYNVGIDSFVPYMQSLGISTWDDPGRYVLPMALGGVEVKMVDEATAYGALANLGKKAPLTGILKLQDSKEDVIAELNPQPVQVMPEGVAYIISDILADNAARAATFGPGSQLEIPGYKVAVKTGTTDSKRDNWTFGYTPEYLVSVWIGNNDNTPMNPAIESGATGASSLWHRVMKYLLENKAAQPKTWYSKPSDIVEKSCGSRVEYFISGTEGSYNCGPSPTEPRRPQQRRIPQAINDKKEKYNTNQGQQIRYNSIQQ